MERHAKKIGLSFFSFKNKLNHDCMMINQFEIINFCLVFPLNCKHFRGESNYMLTWVSKKSIKKGVLKNFATFTGKDLYQSLFFSKIASCLRPATLLKKRFWNMCSPVSFTKFSRTLFTEHVWWLLLFRFL